MIDYMKLLKVSARSCNLGVLYLFVFYEIEFFIKSVFLYATLMKGLALDEIVEVQKESYEKVKELQEKYK